MTEGRSPSACWSAAGGATHVRVVRESPGAVLFSASSSFALFFSGEQKSGSGHHIEVSVSTQFRENGRWKFGETIRYRIR